MRDLNANGWRFNIPESWEETAKELANEAIPLRSFVDEFLVPDADHCTPMEVIKALHDEHGNEDIPKDTLRSQLQALGLRVTQLSSQDADNIDGQKVFLSNAGVGNRKRPYVLRGHRPADLSLGA